MIKENIDKSKIEIEEWLMNRLGYLKKSPEVTYLALANELDPDRYFKSSMTNLIKGVQKHMRQIPKGIFKKVEGTPIDIEIDDFTNFKIKENKPIKRLFLDIETSPNTVFSWSIGSRIRLTPDNIINERSLICIAYKWENEEKINCIEWNKGDDENLCKKIVEIINSADEIVTHNGDKFDLPWIRTRCLFHNIELKTKINSIDTLKIARRYFRLNSNKLNYIAKFLNLEGKQDTTYDLWKDIVLHNDRKALDTMKEYCKNDVQVLQNVYDELIDYVPKKVKILN